MLGLESSSWPLLPSGSAVERLRQTWRQTGPSEDAGGRREAQRTTLTVCPAKSPERLLSWELLLFPFKSSLQLGKHLKTSEDTVLNTIVVWWVLSSPNSKVF